MSTEENLRITERFVEAFNAQNWTQFSELLTEDASYDSPIHPEPLKGNSAFVQYFKDIFVAYPDCKAETHRLFGQGNNICWEGALTGTHEGPIRDIAPTHKSVRIPFCHIYTFKDGKISDAVVFLDRLGYFSQLGIQ